MLGQRLRRWPNFKPTLVQCIVFVGLPQGGAVDQWLPEWGVVPPMSPDLTPEMGSEEIHCLQEGVFYELIIMWHFNRDSKLQDIVP